MRAALIAFTCCFFDMAENKETAYRTLLAEIKRYLCLKADYYKLTGIEKLSMLLASITIAGIVAILMFVALFYLTSALQTCLGDVVGVPLSYVIVAVIYIILGVLVIVFKKALIINPICRMVSRILIERK